MANLSHLSKLAKSTISKAANDICVTYACTKQRLIGYG